MLRQPVRPVPGVAIQPGQAPAIVAAFHQQGDGCGAVASCVTVCRHRAERASGSAVRRRALILFLPDRHFRGSKCWPPIHRHYIRSSRQDAAGGRNLPVSRKAPWRAFSRQFILLSVVPKAPVIDGAIATLLFRRGWMSAHT